MSTRAKRPSRILVIDIGGTNVKMRLMPAMREPVKFPSGITLTPARMVAGVKAALAGKAFDAVSVGFPAPVKDGRILLEPHNLGRGWKKADLARATGKPVKVVNDAVLQALGSYQGGRMLFLGLGTGLGAAVIEGDAIQPLELAHLPYRDGGTYEDYLGQRGFDRLGKKKWRKHVELVAEMLRRALVADYVMLGGGQIKHLKKAPPNCRLGGNQFAFVGGVRLWKGA